VTYNSGTQTVALSIGSGLTTSSGSLALAAHKASHSTGGSDALSPADIGAAAVSHTHSASQVTDFAAAVAAASPEEVLEYTTAASFPATGNASLIYIATDAGRAYRWVGSQYAEIGPAGAFLPVHSHAASDITSGVLDAARIPSLPASQIASGVLDAARLPFATTAQATDWNSAAVAMNPARMLDALTGWAQALPSTSSGASGGAVTAHALQCLADSGSTAGGFVSFYTNSNGGLTTMVSPQSRSVDWTKRRYFCLRVRRESANSSTGFGRFTYGYANFTAAAALPAQRSIGFELRGTTSRLWVLAHNGTTLTQVDTGWDATGGSDLQNEYLLESAGGTVNVYVDGVLRGTATGGPTAMQNDSGGGFSYQVGNGGTAARTAFFISAARFTI
jgi:hypothetical protein